MNNKLFIKAKTDEDRYYMYLSQFKVGDKVRIYKKLGSYEECWNNCWVDDMDRYIGSISYITWVAADKKGIVLTSSTYLYPPQSLEKIK